MNLASWSIRNPIPAIVLFVLLSLTGLWGFRQLGVQDMPDLDLPTVDVVLSLPGAAPAQLETDVARKVEDALARLQGLRHISTDVRNGEVELTVEFELERPLSDALIDVKDAIDQVRNDLPADLQQPQISKAIVVGGPLVLYSLTSSRLDEEGLSWFVDDTVARTLLGIPGVGRFERVGGGQREVQVEVDPARLAALGLTVADVSHAVQRVQLQASGGRGEVDGSEQGVRTLAMVGQAAELAALPVTVNGTHWVRLGEVASIRDTLADRTTAARHDGRPAVGFEIRRARGYDMVQVGGAIDQALARLQHEHPDLKVEKVFDAVPHIQEQYRGSMRMLYEGALLAVVVVWLFLRDWRATLVGAAALPLSIIPTFAVMHWAGYSLNTLTLLALSVIIGILVDDAIVEIENVARHLRMGKSVREATIDAVSEIALPVVATTFALVVVFLPTAFMTGIPGLIFKQFGWTAVVAILVSLLVARVATPMMAAFLMRAEARCAPADGRVLRLYLRGVAACLRHRWLTLACAAGFFVGSLALVPLIPKGFVPAQDRGFLEISVETPPGSTLAATLEAAEAARRAIQEGDHPVSGIAGIFTTVGDAAASSAGEIRSGSLLLTLAPAGTRPPQSVIEGQIRSRLPAIPGARFSMGDNGRLELYLSGRDSVALKASARAIESGLRALPYLSGVVSSASIERPEIVVRPRLVQAAERGVDTAMIGETLRLATSGDFTPALAKLNLDNRQIAIRVRMPRPLRQDLEALGRLRVPGRSGLVPLASVAQLALESGPSEIERYDRARTVSVKADLGGYALGDAMTAAMNLPAVRALPAGVQLVDAGDAEIMNQLFSGFVLALLVGVLCVYCVLVLLFKAFLQPFTILSAIPLALGGAFLALLLAHAELGLPALIGLVMLLGIVTKNSILLVEYAEVAMRERGMAVLDAVVDACHKRARPIVMTSIAMVAGMLPLALGLDGGNTFRQTMAIAVIGGLLTSTALSLLVVPVVFTLVSGLRARLAALPRLRLPARACDYNPASAKESP